MNLREEQTCRVTAKRFLGDLFCSQIYTSCTGNILFQDGLCHDLFWLTAFVLHLSPASGPQQVNDVVLCADVPEGDLCHDFYFAALVLTSDPTSDPRQATDVVVCAPVPERLSTHHLRTRVAWGWNNHLCLYGSRGWEHFLAKEIFMSVYRLMLIKIWVSWSEIVLQMY